MALSGFDIQVSSHLPRHPKDHLLDGKTTTFWQSNRNQKPHWIRLLSKDASSGRIGRFSLDVSRSDNSYCPDHVEIHAGSDAESLTKVADVNIKEMTDGTTGTQQIHIREVVEPLDEMPFWSVIEVRVMSCIDGGIDCKVRGVKVEVEQRIPPSRFQTNMAQLFEEGQGADVTFSVGNVDIPAHRCILSAQNPVLKALLMGQFAEGSKGKKKVTVTDVEATVFKQMLRFLYTDELDSAENVKLEALLVAADKYQIDRLRALCELGLVKKLSSETCCDQLVLGKAIGASRLTHAALQHAITHPTEVLKSDGMKRIAEKEPYILLQLFAAASMGVSKGRELCDSLAEEPHSNEPPAKQQRTH
jgi:hypothetical protein